jgi:pilus assembly protein CpaB
VSARTILVVFLALACGGSAVVGLNTLRQGVPSEKSDDTVTVVEAATDIGPYTTLSAGLVTTREYPKDRIPPGAITKVEDVQDRVCLSRLIKGEALLEGKLTARGAGRGLASAIDDGERVFTITTNLASGVAGFILPGYKVDVLLTVSGGGGLDDPTGGGSTTTLLQNVEILAVDQQVVAPAENRVNAQELRSVTLRVTPDQAAKLALAQSKGTLHLSLRSPKDKKDARVGVATMNELRFFQGRPWDERLKGLMEAAGKLLASKPEKEKPAIVPAATEVKTSPLVIQTLYGTVPGVVQLK